MFVLEQNTDRNDEYFINHTRVVKVDVDFNSRYINMIIRQQINICDWFV